MKTWILVQTWILKNLIGTGVKNKDCNMLTLFRVKRGTEDDKGGRGWIYQLADKQRLQVEKRLQQLTGADGPDTMGPLPCHRKRKAETDTNDEKEDKTKNNLIRMVKRANKRQTTEAEDLKLKSKKAKGESMAKKLKKANEEPRANKNKEDKKKEKKVTKAKEAKEKKAKVDRSNPNWKLKPNPAITIWEKVRQHLCIFPNIVSSLSGLTGKLNFC
jgi:hypothetical protein